jgi:cytochrome c oxidase assembly protein subunit 15
MSQITSASVPATTPRWLHVCAVLTVVGTLLMMVLGAEVTTKKVGMIDPAGLRSPLYLIEALWDAGGLQALIERKGSVGWVIEHSHRTVGFALGFCALVLAVGMWFTERRRWVRLAGMLTPFAVLSQGILGILRIELNNRLDPNVGTTFALVHGCVAQLVLALLVAVALWTSRAWTAAGAVPDGGGTARLRKVSLLVVGLIYAQVVLGALVRHKESAFGTRAHVLLAFGASVAVAWLIKLALEIQPRCLTSLRAAVVLTGLVVLQIVLGLETLLSKFVVQWPSSERVQPLALSPDLIRSMHFLVGALTFSATVAVALLAHRHLAWAPRPAPEPTRQLEGAL